MQKCRNERFLEMIPGLLVWITLLSAILLSLIKPLYAIYFIIVFDAYWVCRVLYLLIYMISSWRKYRRNIALNWMQKLQQSNLPWQEYLHCIFLPVYNESYEVLRATFESLKNVNYPTEKFIIFLTGEERAGRREFLQKSKRIQREYQGVFGDIVINVHPANLPGEIPGKGSNLHHAGWRAKAYFDARGWDYSKIIVSAFDIDTCPHREYFAYLTYTFLNHPNPWRASFQPIALYNNNFWESHPLIRVVASSTTFWLFTDLARPERLFTFSSHSMSFQALVDVGFWDKTIVTEDSRIFLQCFVHYRGAYRVEPMFIPVSMNTVDVQKFWRSLINQYKQMRRWAWGVEHFPWMVKHFFSKESRGYGIPFGKKIRYLWNQLEGVYSWASAPLLIFLVGHIPLWFSGDDIVRFTLFQNTPHILSYLMRISMVGIFVISILYLLMLPPKPLSVSPLQYLLVFFQWFLVPFTLIFFGSIPALDAQTRLMLGGRFRLGFWVSEKKAPKKNTSIYTIHQISRESL